LYARQHRLPGRDPEQDYTAGWVGRHCVPSNGCPPNRMLREELPQQARDWAALAQQRDPGGNKGLIELHGGRIRPI